MSLSEHFNSKSRNSRKARTETESIGTQGLSSFFWKAARKQPKAEPVAPALVFIKAPTIIRRGMNI
jgi:hypothetical protein